MISPPVVSPDAVIQPCGCVAALATLGHLDAAAIAALGPARGLLAEAFTQQAAAEALLAEVKRGVE